MRQYLLVGLDDLNDLIVDLPPQQLFSLASIVHRVQEHQLYTKFPQSGYKKIIKKKISCDIKLCGNVNEFCHKQK